MAWSSAALDSHETSGLAADKPLIAVQVLPETPTTAKWTENSDCHAGTDRTLSTQPARRAYDGLVGLATTKDATTSSTWYYYLDVGADCIEFDCAFIINHNFNTISVTACTIEIADDGSFTSNVQVIADFGAPASDDRLADLVLKHTGDVALRYSDVRYLRLKVTAAGNISPTLGELILGKRFQQDRRPDRPFNPDNLINDFTLSRTIGGVSYRYNLARNRFELEAEWPVDSSTYETEWLEFWSLCTGPFVWIYEPSTAPNDWRYMILASESLEFAIETPTVRYARLKAVEQGPESFYLENE